MVRIDDTIWCDGCGVEIVGKPVVKTGKGSSKNREYCCEACSEGLECSCLGWAEQDEYSPRRRPMPEGNFTEDTY